MNITPTGHAIQKQHPRVVHELPRRIRLKGGVLRHGLLDFDYLEAHLGSLLGVIPVRRELTPEDKARVVCQLKAEGYNVAVVGDGVNDAPALISADLGICMAHDGDLARASAQAVILNDDLRALCTARHIKKPGLTNLSAGRPLEGRI